ncbi:hypothetical protein H2200_012144 [Cladophialophora chaetospira]|uniref:Tryptophan synthase beta chain-like PALP domain-containing protein n=1 Tax=Cladophialophora chaetospira TaxID=386627 RepID=A0AA39CCN6_9EURO|nr:hypothetical protein H2200_012144 [Cladophialophora chaetospira]
MVQLPEPFASIPRHQLLYPGPTPVRKLERVSKHYSSSTTPEANVTVWVKHEDANSPLAGGGSKIRKLEYLVSDILASEPKVDTLVTVGGVQSNHCRQVAAVGVKLGIKVVAVHSENVPGQPEEYYKMGNLQLSRLMGSTSDVGGNVEDTMEKIRKEGRTPYFIPSGASTHPLGGLGFARWAFEVVEQEQDLGVFFNTIVVSLGSGSTVAGMIAGFKLADRQGKDQMSRKRKIVCVDAMSRPISERKPMILDIARNTAAQIGLDANDVDEKDIIIEDRFSSGAYGLPQDSTLDAMRKAASLEALILDPVYTGKAFAAVLGMLETEEVDSGGNILFCHTGGTAVLGAYSIV